MWTQIDPLEELFNLMVEQQDPNALELDVLLGHDKQWNDGVKTLNKKTLSEVKRRCISELGDESLKEYSQHLMNSLKENSAESKSELYNILENILENIRGNVENGKKGSYAENAESTPNVSDVKAFKQGVRSYFLAFYTANKLRATSEQTSTFDVADVSEEYLTKYIMNHLPDDTRIQILEICVAPFALVKSAIDE